ncbi:MAG: hypothetical protein M1409_02610, partial [Actinobacteria bacterium]|nr:hypothetical protein [Actinomycetota bacterium]
MSGKINLLNSKENKLKIALLYFDNYDYNGDKYEVFPKSVKYFEKLSNNFNLELKVINKKIRTSEESNEIIRKLEVEKIDFIVMLIGTGPRGEAVLPVISKLWPIGIWSVPEPTSSGPLPLNSLMGANLVSSIAREYLKRSYPFKYFYGWPDDNILSKRFEITFKSLRSLKILKNTKIGWLVGLVPGFFDFCIDEKEINNKYGVEVIKIDYKELKKRLESFKEDSVEMKVSQIKNHTTVKLPLKELLKAAKIDLLLEELIEQYSFDTIALGCWPELMEDFGAAPCSSVARFTDMGIPVACEGDVLGAIDMMLLKNISNSTPFLMDIVSMNEKDESICAWHCGCTPPKYASGK